MGGLRELAHKYMSYDMIEKYVSLPEFPELRTRLLRGFLQQGRRADGKPNHSEAIALAVSLAQMGLDTHELVDGKDEMRRKQMNVLAGDYFSSRFYQMLSQTDDVRSISLLSQSICEVNRMKMNLYSSAKRLLLTAEQYVKAMVEVNSHLYLAFTSWMDGFFRKIWPTLLRTVAECEILSAELRRDRPETMKHSWAYWYVLQHGTKEEIQSLMNETMDADWLEALWTKYEIRYRLLRLWEEKLEELKSLAVVSRLNGVPDELIRLLEPLFGGTEPANAVKVLEEI